MSQVVSCRGSDASSAQVSSSGDETAPVTVNFQRAVSTSGTVP